jgi:alpha-1,3-glucosyltransferase
MWPLLSRDGLALQYTVLFLFYAWLMGSFHNLPNHWFGKLVHIGSYGTIITIHLAEVMIGKVERYPDLWAVGNVLVSFGAFTIAWGWTILKLWTESSKAKLD